VRRLLRRRVGCLTGRNIRGRRQDTINVCPGNRPSPTSMAAHAPPCRPTRARIRR
jgi:hypothetical protein